MDSDLPGQQPPLLGLTLDESITEAHQIIHQARETYPHVAVVALFSGGNDSTTLLHLAKDQIDFALHINTGIGIEETREFARSVVADWSVPFVEKFTDPAWYVAAVEKHGFPGPPKHGTMYVNLKERRLREVRRGLIEKRGQKVLLLSGVRAYESQRRMGHAEVMSVKDGFIWANPIHYFTDWHMWQYRKMHRVPRSPVADMIHKSGECLCGAYTGRLELTELDMFFPKAADYIHDLERKAEQAGHGKRAKWGWGEKDRPRTQTAPGPMCSSCHQIPLEETA